MYKDLKQVIEKPFKEIEKQGGITKLSEKTFAKIGKLIGGSIEYVALPAVAVVLAIPALLYDYCVKDTTTEIKQPKTNGLENKLFKIQKTGNLESLPYGVKSDIELLLKLPTQFTLEDLDNAFKNGQKKFHPDKLSGNQERWDQLHSLYEELLWYFFKPTNNEEQTQIATGNYPKLREKSYRYRSNKYQVNQVVRFDDGKVATVAQIPSCQGEGYYLINTHDGSQYDNVKEEDIMEVLNV